MAPRLEIDGLSKAFVMHLQGGKTLPVVKNSFAIDSSKEQTIYYEVVFK